MTDIGKEGDCSIKELVVASRAISEVADDLRDAIWMLYEEGLKESGNPTFQD